MSGVAGIARTAGRWVLAASVALLVACGEPVPPGKSAYVGDWRSPSMTIRIAQDGRVAYKRVNAGVTTSVEGPIRRFEGDNFVVGIPGVSTTFVVSRPPAEKAGRWTMVVDGVELVRGP